MFYLNEYRTYQEYGGPEEGGWWYSCGQFIQCHGIFENAEGAKPDTAYQAAVAVRDSAEMQEYIDSKCVDTFTPSSPRHQKYVLFIQDHEGADYPTERPYYC